MLLDNNCGFLLLVFHAKFLYGDCISMLFFQYYPTLIYSPKLKKLNKISLNQLGKKE